MHWLEGWTDPEARNTMESEKQLPLGEKGFSPPSGFICYFHISIPLPFSPRDKAP